MEAKRLKQEVRLRQWAERVKDCQCSGKPISVWCKENGIPKQTYYNWQRKVREALCGEMSTNMPQPILDEPVSMTLPEFAEIPAPGSTQNLESPVITLRMGRTVCEIYNGASKSIVEAALRAVTSKKC